MPSCPSSTRSWRALPEPNINLAAYGGIVFPLILIIESPIIMLLGASTALSKDWASYQLMYRFMMIVTAVLTVLHALIAFTPLYYFVANGILGARPESSRRADRPDDHAALDVDDRLPPLPSGRADPLRAFAHDRRRHMVRLLTDAIILAVGFSLRLEGIVVATLAIAGGVTMEAIYTGLVVRPLLRPSGELRLAAPVQPALISARFPSRSTSHS